MFSPYAKKLLNRTVPNRSRHRIRQPRGGRRPGGHSRPLTPQASPSPLSQSFPAPSWGSMNAASTSGGQQSSGSFTFGQQPGSSANDQMNSQPSSFPSFGATNSSTNAQTSAPTSTGFNFTAPAMTNNPFASLNQQPNPSASSGGFSSSGFNFTPTTPNLSQHTFQKPASELGATGDQGMNSQSLFLPQAPFNWGQSDASSQGQAQQASSEPNATGASQQSSQASNDIFGQKVPLNQGMGDIFRNIQPQPSTSSNPFTQQPNQQSQTSNVFGASSETSFSPRSDQPVANFFGQPLGQSQDSSTTSAEPATSPTENGDAMSTTPDTSPQSNNDRARYGLFALDSAASKPTLTNGDTRNGTSNLFDFSSKPSSTQATDMAANKESLENLSAATSKEGGGDAPSNISLGSPKKGQGSSISEGNNGLLNTERQGTDGKTVEKQSFAAIDFTASQGASPTPPPAFDLFSNASEKQSNSISAGSSSSTIGQLIDQRHDAPNFFAQRRPGIPPTPPQNFSEEQKRQLITGYRLKALDSGLRSYLEYSSYGKEEIESISIFYELRKQAILKANGGSVEDLYKKRPAEADLHRSDPQNKRARQQPPVSDIERPSQNTTLDFGGQISPKRKANEDLSTEEDRAGQPSASKKSKPESQVTYPSLPPSFPGSQTAHLFGNLVGKKTHTDSDGHKQPTANGFPSDSIAPTKASIFPQVQNSNGASNAETTAANNVTQKPSFGFSNDPSSAPLQPTSGNLNYSSHSQGTPATTPFKGFVPSPSMSGNNQAPVSGSPFTVPPSFSAPQSSHGSSVLGSFNNSASDPSNSKRKADDDTTEPETAEGFISNAENDPRSKKQRTDGATKDTSEMSKGESSILKSHAEKGRAGFAESILSHGAKLSNNSSNMFSHLQGSSHDQDDDEADDEDDEAEETGRGSTPAKKPNTTVESSKLSENNPFGSSVVNPFVGSKFKTPTQVSGAEKPEGRSFFDRIERDEKGQPLKMSEPVSFGGSVLKTPATKNAGTFFGQPHVSTSSAMFGGTSDANPTPGSSAFGNTFANSTNTSSSTTPGSNTFSFLSNPTVAPTAPDPSTTGTGESPAEDRTWKPGTPVKFANASDAPSISLSSPSPVKTPLTGLFGASKANLTSTAPASLTFKQFDSTSPKPAPLTFGISAPVKDPSESLAPPSGTQSESTSRATSPGATAGESSNEASDDIHAEEGHLELDNTAASKAEAEEETLFDSKAKLFKFTESKQHNEDTNKEEIIRKWTPLGNEQFRVLQHRVTKKTRMIMTLKMNGRVVLNAGLQKSLNYVLAAPRKVRIPVPTKNKVETWLVQLENEDDGQKLVRTLEDNKGN
ncbi:MAG: hypothetical protein Q9222_003319 [Ikaeria aurantiellina]